MMQLAERNVRSVLVPILPVRDIVNLDDAGKTNRWTKDMTVKRRLGTRRLVYL